MRSAPALRRLTAADVPPLELGVSLLGSGGGGDAGMLAHVLRRGLGGGSLPVLDPGDLGDAPVVPVGIIGATRVFAEKLPDGTEFAQAVAAVSRWTGRRPAAVMDLEVGGLNGLSGAVAALDLGLPLVDADLMGRALPRLDQFTWAACGQPMTPCVVREPGGRTLLVDGAAAPGLERSIRAMLAESGGWAALALPPVAARDIPATCVTGGLARAAALGRAAERLPSTPDRAALAGALGGRVLTSGRVVDVDRHGVSAGSARGSVTVVDTGNGAVLRLESENEFLVALHDGEPVATCPDLLCALDRRTGRPLAVDTVRTGNEVVVVAIPGPAWWLRTGHLARVGPRAFGIDCDPVLMEGA
ncbi:DUF917 domain-containing protein [Geodermatophilus sp. SYSU D00697]